MGKYEDNYEKAFGKGKTPEEVSKSSGQVTRVIGKKAPGDTKGVGLLKSLAMGCPNGAEKARRLREFANMGISAKYDPKSHELCFKGGYQTQKRLAKWHGMYID